MREHASAVRAEERLEHARVQPVPQRFAVGRIEEADLPILACCDDAAAIGAEMRVKHFVRLLEVEQALAVVRLPHYDGVVCAGCENAFSVATEFSRVNEGRVREREKEFARRQRPDLNLPGWIYWRFGVLTW